MAQAAKRLPPASVSGNDAPPTDHLSLNQMAAALVALLNGADSIPPIGQLRSMVRRGMARTQRARATGGRHHG
jgi:hypothetical protein